MLKDLLKDKSKLLDIVCFIIGPMLLTGAVVETITRDIAGAVIGVALIMTGIVARIWRKEKHEDK